MDADCVLYEGPKDKDGYGVIYRYRRHPLRAHRVAWEKEYGPIPPRTSVLHKCDTPACINPRHLFLGNHQQNMDDACSKGRKGIKLTSELAVYIMARLLTGELQSSVARAFNINDGIVSRLWNGHIWAHAMRDYNGEDDC